MKKDIKKVISFLMVTLSLLALNSCGQSQTNVPQSTGNNNAGQNNVSATNNNSQSPQPNTTSRAS